MNAISDQILTELQATLADAIEKLDECKINRPRDQQAIAGHAAHVAATQRAITVIENVIGANFTQRVRAKADHLAAARLPDMLQTAKAELDAVIARSASDYRAIGMAYMRVRSIKLASDLAAAGN
jgi:hypothetical protein